MNGYKLLLASAVGERDGMAVELAVESGERLAEVFEDDLTKERTVTFFTVEAVPLAVVEWFLTEAARRL
ncbi:hypothetical protein [Demequina sp.]|uniref:hypothetical protein n=1 Tax=Demequina sp. TaxID=2050685 RepID=UPI003D09F837